MYEPILTDFIGLGPYRWGSILLFMFGALIPLSRMYLGLHSADQILVGLTMSFCFLVSYRFLMQKLLFQYAFSCAFGKKYRIIPKPLHISRILSYLEQNETISSITGSLYLSAYILSLLSPGFSGTNVATIWPETSVVIAPILLSSR